MTDLLIDIIKSEGVNLFNENDVRESIDTALERKMYKFIQNKEGITIGFFTWVEKIKNNKLYIFINNLFILKEHKFQFSLFTLRELFKNIYPNTFFYWKNRKSGKYFYYYLRGKK